MPGKGTPFRSWTGNIQLKDVLEKGKIRSFQELKHSGGWKKTNEWGYLQLKHFVNTLLQPIRNG